MVERGNWGKRIKEIFHKPQEKAQIKPQEKPKEKLPVKFPEMEFLADVAAGVLIGSVREQLPENEREKNPYWRMSGEHRKHIAAARLKLTLDRRAGRETPEWIKKLANENVFAVLENEPSENFIPSEHDMVYANILTTANRRRGKETPAWIIKLAETKKTS